MTEFRKIRFDHNILKPIFAFLISFFIVLYIFIINGMLFGEFLILRSDLLEGVSLYKGVCRDILTGNNPFFTFSVGLGTNNSLALAFSFFSPFNLLYLLFYNADISLITALIIALKIGFSSFFFYIFSDNFLSKRKFVSILFSVFYSTCAFSLAYGTIHIYWLDAVMVLPLMIYSILRCINSNRRVLMILLYSYLFISCFYMGYIVGVFSFIFVVLYFLLIYECKTETKLKEKLKLFINWAIGVLIAIILSCVVWAPALFFLAANRAEDATSAVTIITPLTFIINSLFWGISSGISGVYGYVYCGVPALILVPLFFFNKKIKNNIKLFYAILLVFYFISTIVVPLNQFMHAMDQPDFFWYRFSFIISFIICTICAKQADNIETQRKLLPFATAFVWIIFYVIVQQSISFWSIPDGEFSINSNTGLVVNICLLISWITIGFVYIKNKSRILCYTVAVVVLIIEISTNARYFLPYKEEKLPYKNLENFMDVNLNAIKNSGESGLYRTIVNNTKDFTGGYYYGYNDFSYFGSQEKYDVRKFLSNIGFSTSTRMVVNNGHNPVSDMLMGVKYYINCPDELYDSSSLISEIPISCYRNNRSLSIGYLVSGETIFQEFEGRNVFDNTNSLIKTISGINKDVFFRVSDDDIFYDFDGIDMFTDDEGKTVFKRTGENGSLLISVPSLKYNDVYVQFEEEIPSYIGTDFEVVFSDNYSNNDMDAASCSCSNKMSLDQCGYYYISLYSDENLRETFSCDSINVYSIDYDVLDEQYQELSVGQYNITEWSNGHIKGNINVEGEKRLMLLTVPFDAGWKAYINGQETEIVRLLEGSFMGIFFPKEGIYEVSFEYEVPGLKIGAIVSLCGLLALLSVIFEKKLKK